MSEKESKKLEKAEQVKEAVEEKTKKVKETAKKHPKLVTWIKRIGWALIGALTVLFAPQAAKRLASGKTVTGEDTETATTEG